MTLGLRIYAVVGIAVIVCCLALVVAMVVDAQLQPNSASDVLSSVDNRRGD